MKIKKISEEFDEEFDNLSTDYSIEPDGSITITNYKSNGEMENEETVEPYSTEWNEAYHNLTTEQQIKIDNLIDAEFGGKMMEIKKFDKFETVNESINNDENEFSLLERIENLERRLQNIESRV